MIWLLYLPGFICAIALGFYIRKGIINARENEKIKQAKYEKDSK